MKGRNPGFNPTLIHPTRFRALAELVQSPSGEFSFIPLQSQLEIENSGTLAQHLKRLARQDYVQIRKSFRGVVRLLQ